MVLQPLLMEVIDAYKMSFFLLLYYILHNVILICETFGWTLQSNQEVIFIKVDFAKAYDIVAWEFIFLAMSFV